jgi:multidrug efflux pump subunit AcrA (membrane-fusion protein)
VSGQQEIAGKHQLRQIDLTLKIPAAQYQPVLAKLKGLGTKISFSSHAVDVTQQVADVGSRVASAQAAIKQLRALLSKAGSVGELLSVQQSINRQESDLEALLAQQRALAHETSYATVTAILVAHHAKPVAKPEKTSPGFLAGLRGGWHALVTVVGWLVTVLGSALPFLIPVLLIGGSIALRDAFAGICLQEGAAQNRAADSGRLVAAGGQPRRRIRRYPACTMCR